MTISYSLFIKFKSWTVPLTLMDIVVDRTSHFEKKNRFLLKKWGRVSYWTGKQILIWMAWLGNEFTQAKFTNYLVVCILLHLNSFKRVQLHFQSCQTRECEFFCPNWTLYIWKSRYLRYFNNKKINFTFPNHSA